MDIGNTDLVRHHVSTEQELQLLRRRRRADRATIEALTTTLTQLQRAARALGQENAELRRENAERSISEPPIGLVGDERRARDTRPMFPGVIGASQLAATYHVDRAPYVEQIRTGRR
jgi:hypothetical protein